MSETKHSPGIPSGNYNPSYAEATGMAENDVIQAPQSAVPNIGDGGARRATGFMDYIPNPNVKERQRMTEKDQRDISGVIDGPIWRDPDSRDYVPHDEAEKAANLRKSRVIQLAEKLAEVEKKRIEKYKKAKQIVAESEQDPNAHPEGRVVKAREVVKHKPRSKKELYEEAKRQVYASNRD